MSHESYEPDRPELDDPRPELVGVELVHLRHPVDNLPCCGSDDPDAVETNDVGGVTCDACLATL